MVYLIKIEKIPSCCAECEFLSKELFAFGEMTDFRCKQQDKIIERTYGAPYKYIKTRDRNCLFNKKVIRCHECEYADGQSRICKLHKMSINELDFCKWGKQKEK